MLSPVHPPTPRLAGRISRLAASLVLALGLVSGCGGHPPASSATAEIAAPYPFTVYEIRAGCPLGRVIEYRIEKEGAPPRIERWAFTPLDPDTVSVTTTAYDADGNPQGAPTTESAKWTALHEHARFPRSATRIYNESLTVSAGTFDVMRYVVTKPDEAGKLATGDAATYWFARTLPGPPVKVEITKDGHVAMTMTMQANRTH
jgi:hypothetical protein